MMQLVRPHIYNQLRGEFKLRILCLLVIRVKLADLYCRDTSENQNNQLDHNLYKEAYPSL
jgi:hypothetical protein